MELKEWSLTASPFLTPGRPKVFVSAGAGPYQNMRAAIAGIDLSPARGKKVLLKPNAGRAALPGSGITTHPEALAAAIDAFREAGAIVAVGESPISGVTTLEAFESTGMAAVARARNCPLLDMDARPFVEIAVPDGEVLRSLKLCPELLEFDIIVSIPVMKMHMHTGVTLAIKNMKGCLWRRSKVQLHMLPPIPGREEKPIDIAIADMAMLLRPHLSLVDGSIGMEGMGPSAGRPKQLDVAVVSADAFAADAVSCRLMGTRAEDVPHLRLAAARGAGVIELSGLDIFPGTWERWASPFAPPPASVSIEYPEVDVLDKNSCSACQSTLTLFLKGYGKKILDYFPGSRPCFVIGKGHDSVPPGAVCIGNCTIKHKDMGIFIKGCPPVGSEILGAITGRPSFDILDGQGKTEEPLSPKD